MYKNLKMFIHAEGRVGSIEVKDDELLGIIRLGSDTDAGISFRRSTKTFFQPKESRDDDIAVKLSMLSFCSTLLPSNGIQGVWSVATINPLSEAGHSLSFLRLSMFLFGSAIASI